MNRLLEVKPATGARGCSGERSRQAIDRPAVVLVRVLTCKYIPPAFDNLILE